MLKRIISIISIIMVMLLFLTPTLTIAAESNQLESNISKKLKQLELIKDENLQLAEEQLKEQGMMEHYEIHKQLIEKDYSTAKSILLCEITPRSSTSYYFDDGGQLRYEITEGYGYEVTEEYYIQSQLQIILNEWNANNNFTIGGLATLVIGTIAGYTISNIGYVIAGYSIFSYLSSLVSKTTLTNVTNYGYGVNRTVEGVDVGRSSIWLKWYDHPLSTFVDTDSIIDASYF